MAAAMPFVSIIGSLVGSLGGLFGKKDKSPKPPEPVPTPPPPAAPKPEEGISAPGAVASEAERAREIKRRQAAATTLTSLEPTNTKKKTLLGE